MSAFGSQHQNDGVFQQIQNDDAKLAAQKAAEDALAQDPETPTVVEADDALWAKERQEREQDQRSDAQ
jgi:hypothetical protein